MEELRSLEHGLFIEIKGIANTMWAIDVKKKIVALKNSKENLTIVKDIKTHYGGAYALGKVYIYDNAKELQYFEPFYILVRNLPKEKRTEIRQLKKKKEPYKHLFNFK